MTRTYARIALASMVALTGTAASAQSDVEKQRQAQAAETRLHEDWAWLGRYQSTNAALSKPGNHRVVFIGDSITQGWFDMVPAFFADDRMGRGIGGQTTPQMLLRFRQDVIDLHPAVVQIIGGTNDIASNTLPMTPSRPRRTSCRWPISPAPTASA